MGAIFLILLYGYIANVWFNPGNKAYIFYQHHQHWWLFVGVIASSSNSIHICSVSQQNPREELLEQEKRLFAGAQFWWVIKVWIQDDTIFYWDIYGALLDIILGARDTAMNTTEETDRDPEAPAQSSERSHNIKITFIVANGLKESKEGQSEK